MDNQKLYYLTRSSRFLWKSVLGILLLIVAISVLFNLIGSKNNISYEKLYSDVSYGNLDFSINTEELSRILQQELALNESFETKLETFDYLLYLDAEATLESLPFSTEVPNLNAKEYQILSTYGEAIAGITDSNNFEEPTKLIALTKEAPTPVYASYALALFYDSVSKAQLSIDAIKTEIKNHPSDASRYLLIDIYWEYERYEAIKELQLDSEFASLIPNLLLRDIALQTMDWNVLIKTLIPVAYEDTKPSMVLLALLTGVAWATFLLKINGSLSWKSPAVRLAIPALLLGALSAHLTILVIYFQENQFGLQEGDTTLSLIIYSVAGIGFREEFLKLLCFLPLIPFLIKRKNDLEILIVASLVGLGFAIEENISYFQESQGISAFGRFITANFFHISLTGLCGITLVQAFINRGAFINTAITTFGLAVLIHGAYDAFLIAPELSEYSIASMIIFILFSYQYFTWIRHLRSHWRDPISLSALFTFSMVLVVGASYLVHSFSVGPFQAFTELSQEVLGLAILLFMFYREIPEEIS